MSEQGFMRPVEFFKSRLCTVRTGPHRFLKFQPRGELNFGIAHPLSEDDSTFKSTQVTQQRTLEVLSRIFACASKFILRALAIAADFNFSLLLEFTAEFEVQGPWRIGDDTISCM